MDSYLIRGWICSPRRRNALRRGLWLGMGAGLSLIAGSAAAHHSFSMFDRSKGPQRVEGTVKEWQWTSPHTWLQIFIAPPGGAVEEWAVESASPMELGRFGWSRTLMKPGDKVTITYFPFKDGRKGGQLIGVATADGKNLGWGMPTLGPPGSPPDPNAPRGGPPGAGGPPPGLGPPASGGPPGGRPAGVGGPPG